MKEMVTRPNWETPTKHNNAIMHIWGNIVLVMTNDDSGPAIYITVQPPFWHCSR